MAMGMCSSSSSPKATKPCSPKAPTSTTTGGSSHQETIKLPIEAFDNPRICGYFLRTRSAIRHLGRWSRPVAQIFPICLPRASAPHISEPRPIPALQRPRLLEKRSFELALADEDPHEISAVFGLVLRSRDNVTRERMAEVQKQKLALRQQIDQQQPSAQPPSPSSGGRCSTSNKKTIATNSFRASNWIECQKRFPEGPISWLRVSRQFQLLRC